MTHAPTLTRSPAPLRPALLLLLGGCLAPMAQADEGMWTFEHAPLAQIRERHGVALTPEWLQRLQGAAVHVGASASFVSANGLLLTNHHVVESCLAALSSPQQDLLEHGFVARQPAEERRCPGFVARVLTATEDVSARIQGAAAAGANDEARAALRKAEIGRLETGCSDAAQGLRCTVVSLYSGAQYQLYRYRQWDDVRMVWAPEARSGFYGGDPDNFVYPRFALDAALMRVYQEGRPLQPAQHLRLAERGPREGELLFVAGHPGRTERLKTVAQLEALRDVEYPLMLATARAEQAALHAYARRSPEAARQAQSAIFGTENWLKASLGEYEALREPALLAGKREQEMRLRAAYAQRQLPGDPWRQISEATLARNARADALWALGYGYKTLFQMAGRLVELSAERELPEAQRLAEYRDAALPDLERGVLAERPYPPDLEIVRLGTLLTRARTLLGPQHPMLQAALAGDTPERAAERLVHGSRLGERAERERLLRGGAAAVQASDDPLIGLARVVAPLRRELRLFEENQVDAPIRRAAESIDQARFALFGHSQPPDATNTLRLSYGVASGYTSNGLHHPWKTTWGGWWDRADSFDARPPFDLAPRIDRARSTVDARTPLDFVLTADIIGGNSGSPVVNADGDWVGLIFDGNLEGLGGAFSYTDTAARAIAVHAQAIVTALDQVYGAPTLVAELRRR